MTKTPESGENEVTEEAKREAARTGSPVCDILAAMLAETQAVGDKARERKIVQAQKFLRCRNKRKRRRNP